MLFKYFISTPLKDASPLHTHLIYLDDTDKYVKNNKWTVRNKLNFVYQKASH